jgi:hypothetical protein
MDALTRREFCLTVAAAGVGVACGGGPAAPAFATDHTRVLFIGNSLTYTNDLPGLVRALAQSVGNTTLDVAAIAEPDFALEDHWSRGQAQQWLSQRRWEYVVLQQGSSALPESQVQLRTWATRFAPLIRQAGAEPVLCMVWPTSARLFDFPNVLDSYRNAAAAVGGIFAPAGDAWTARGSYDGLYADGLHPTLTGSYLAAMVLLERLTGVRPTTLGSTLPGLALDSAGVRALQVAAETAGGRQPRKPGAAAGG